MNLGALINILSNIKGYLLAKTRCLMDLLLEHSLPSILDILQQTLQNTFKNIYVLGDGISAKY